MHSLEARPKRRGGRGGSGPDLGWMGKAAGSDAPQPRGRVRSQTGRVEAAPATRRRLNSKTRTPSAAATVPNAVATVSSAAAKVSSAAATLLDAASTVSNTVATVSNEAATVHGNLLEELEAAEGAGELAATVCSMPPFVASPSLRSPGVPCWSGASGEENVLRRLATGVVADLPDETLARALANMQNMQEAVSAGRPYRIG